MQMIFTFTGDSAPIQLTFTSDYVPYHTHKALRSQSPQFSSPSIKPGFATRARMSPLYPWRQCALHNTQFFKQPQHTQHPSSRTTTKLPSHGLQQHSSRSLERGMNSRRSQVRSRVMCPRGLELNPGTVITELASS